MFQSISSSSPLYFFFVSLFFVLPLSEVLFVVWTWLRLRWEATVGQDRCVGCRDARKPMVWQMLLRPASSASSGPFLPRCKATEAHSAGESWNQISHSVHSSHTANSLHLLWICMWGYSSTLYKQTSFNEGQVLVLSTACSLIFRYIYSDVFLM